MCEVVGEEWQPLLISAHPLCRAVLAIVQQVVLVALLPQAFYFSNSRVASGVACMEGPHLQQPADAVLAQMPILY